MDNCSGNGDKLFAAVKTIASGWVEKGHADKGFLDYVRNPAKLSFPCSMIDKITPRPDDGVRDMLASIGFEDTQTFITEKNTYVAAFVNAEETQYLVIEDSFPNGRPALEKTGVYFTSRETVDKVEKMKVCTCLNPLHTALAVFGCLLGYTKISDEMRDAELVKLIKGIGYTEGLPVVVDPGIIKPQEFIDQVVKVRFPNPFMPDTPQRIATDTSLKLPIRFGETLRSYKERGLDLAGLKFLPLVFAGWLRYLLGMDDNGNRFTPSPDPQLEALTAQLSGIKLGDEGGFHEKLKPILSNKEIFALDLYEAGLGEWVEARFTEMLSGPGAVRKVLQNVVGVT
jgi:fructuronate reductase